MCYLATTTFFSWVFFFFNDIFLPVPSRTLLSPNWFSLSCPRPHLLPIESGFDCTMEKKNLPLYISVQSGTDVSCPLCPFGGNIAMLQRFNCANRVGGSQRQCRTWSCVTIKLQWFIYFSFRSTKSLFFGLLLTIFISETCFLEP